MMRGFSSGPHRTLIVGLDHSGVRSINLSRASLALLVAAVLLGGFVLGSTLPTLGENPEATSSPSASAVSPGEGGLPMADVPGEDLERLPRYPGSVRSEFGVTMDERYRLTTVEFLADAPLDEVRSFYQGVIADQRWQRADIDFSGGEWTYILVDGAIEALIELEIAAGLVEIDLHISEPIPAPSADPTPAPTTAPPPPQPAPAPPDDDDDDDDDGDGGSDDDGETDG
jgi:hypothetical protein